MNKLVHGDIEVTKKEFYESQEGIKLKDIIVNNIIVSEKVKINHENALHSSIILDILLMIMLFH